MGERGKGKVLSDPWATDSENGTNERQRPALISRTPVGDRFPAPEGPTLEVFFSEEAPDELLDPISMQLFEHAVVLPSGNTYDESVAIKLKEDPQTRIPIDHTSLLPNMSLQRMVDNYVSKCITEFLEKMRGSPPPEYVKLLAVFLPMLAGRTTDPALRAQVLVFQQIHEDLDSLSDALTAADTEDVQRRIVGALLSIDSDFSRKALYTMLSRVPSLRTVTPPIHVFINAIRWVQLVSSPDEDARGLGMKFLRLLLRDPYCVNIMQELRFDLSQMVTVLGVMDDVAETSQDRDDVSFLLQTLPLWGAPRRRDVLRLCSDEELSFLVSTLQRYGNNATNLQRLAQLCEEEPRALGLLKDLPFKELPLLIALNCSTDLARILFEAGILSVRNFAPHGAKQAEFFGEFVGILISVVRTGKRYPDLVQDLVSLLSIYGGQSDTIRQEVLAFLRDGCVLSCLYQGDELVSGTSSLVRQTCGALLQVVTRAIGQLVSQQDEGVSPLKLQVNNDVEDGQSSSKEPNEQGDEPPETDFVGHKTSVDDTPPSGESKPLRSPMPLPRTPGSIGKLANKSPCATTDTKRTLPLALRLLRTLYLHHHSVITFPDLRALCLGRLCTHSNRDIAMSALSLASAILQTCGVDDRLDMADITTDSMLACRIITVRMGNLQTLMQISMASQLGKSNVQQQIPHIIPALQCGDDDMTHIVLQRILDVYQEQGDAVNTLLRTMREDLRNNLTTALLRWVKVVKTPYLGVGLQFLYIVLGPAINHPVQWQRDCVQTLLSLLSVFVEGSLHILSLACWCLARLPPEKVAEQGADATLLFEACKKLSGDSRLRDCLSAVIDYVSKEEMNRIKERERRFTTESFPVSSSPGGPSSSTSTPSGPSDIRVLDRLDAKALCSTILETKTEWARCSEVFAAFNKKLTSHFVEILGVENVSSLLGVVLNEFHQRSYAPEALTFFRNVGSDVGSAELFASFNGPQVCIAILLRLLGAQDVAFSDTDTALPQSLVRYAEPLQHLLETLVNFLRDSGAWDDLWIPKLFPVITGLVKVSSNGTLVRLACRMLSCSLRSQAGLSCFRKQQTPTLLFSSLLAEGRDAQCRREIAEFLFHLSTGNQIELAQEFNARGLCAMIHSSEQRTPEMLQSIMRLIMNLTAKGDSVRSSLLQANAPAVLEDVLRYCKSISDEADATSAPVLGRLTLNVAFNLSRPSGSLKKWNVEGLHNLIPAILDLLRSQKQDLDLQRDGLYLLERMSGVKEARDSIVVNGGLSRMVMCFYNRDLSSMAWNALLACHDVAVGVSGLMLRRAMGVGDVYTWGRGLEGQLGHGDRESKYKPTPIRELTGMKVIQVSCGNVHSAAVTVDGRIFAWGDGAHGKLGNGSTEATHTPEQVAGDFHAVQVACGDEHTLALSVGGHIYAWGSGESHQLGLANTVAPATQDVLVPTLVVRLRSICQVVANKVYSAALSETGDVYSWGGTSGHFRIPTGAKLARGIVLQLGMTDEVLVALSGDGKLLFRPLESGDISFKNLPFDDISARGIEPSHQGLSIHKESGSVLWFFNDQKSSWWFIPDGSRRNAVSMAVGRHFVAIVENKVQGELWTMAVGECKQGELGHGEPESSFKGVKQVMSMMRTMVFAVSAGTNHAACLAAPVGASKNSRSTCSVCEASFGMKRRKHVCKLCGQVVCDNCALKSLPPLCFRRTCRRCAEEYLGSADVPEQRDHLVFYATQAGSSLMSA